ncbi:DUF2953 domain-containing protein [Anaeromicropila populeti]|uniref:DUF2953 domain-containing protein n=1 Tax=Anaeromicropila populeti TaxID=37658 RepID=A0A1I6KIQ8_9FIRM|nr:DUF2953 domain-containing protein [Anaeromicropila populeti]SFR91125.1 Protein of unknown function [Anaeromicropila populeti]
MPIVFLILKIVGIVIGCISGLAVMLILLILLVPVRYRIKIKKIEHVESYFTVYWLFHIVSMRGELEKNTWNYCLRIFGIPLKHNKDSKIRKCKAAEKSDNGKTEKEQDEVGESGQSEGADGTEKAAVESENKEKKPFFLKRIKDKFMNIYQNIKNSIKNFFTFFKKVLDKKKSLSDFLKEEINRLGIKTFFGTLYEVIRYVRPQKMKGIIYFGTGDPCSTGQALGIFSILYIRYGSKYLKIVPDFNEKVLTMDLCLFGKMRVLRFARVLWKLYRNEEFKNFIGNVKTLKEEF